MNHTHAFGTILYRFNRQTLKFDRAVYLKSCWVKAEHGCNKPGYIVLIEGKTTNETVFAGDWTTKKYIDLETRTLMKKALESQEYKVTK